MSEFIKTTLSKVCSLVTDGTHDTPKVIEKGFPLIKAKEIVGGIINFDDCDHISEEEHLKVISRSHPEYLDILFAHIGASLGETALIKTKRDFSIKNVALFKPDSNKIDNKYTYYYIRTPQFQNSIKNLRTGSAQPFVSLEFLRNHPIEIHSDKIVQRKISGILSNYDDLIENNTLRIQILEEMAQRIYREWFVHFCYPGHENNKLVESELGMIPEGWGVKEILDIPFLRFITENIPRFEGEKTYFATADIDGTKIVKPGIPYSFSSKPSRAQKQPLIYSVWFARMKDTFKVLGFTEVNKTLANNTVLSSGFAGFKSDRDHFGFLYNTIISQNFHKLKDMYSTGATQVSLTNGGFSKIAIVVPPEDIILKYCEIVNSIIDQCLILRNKNVILRQTCDQLLPRLFSGKIDVSELDIDIGEGR